MATRRRPAAGSRGLDELVSQTTDMVAQLLRENRALKAENQRLSRELERLSKGWEDVRRLARSAPRTTSRRRTSK